MSSLGTVEQKLPPGFRFHPRDEELICDYLLKWVTGCAHQSPFLIQVDLNKCEPWDIPESACVGGKEWYFYSQRDRKYATGMRTNRATASGYWKATGKDRPIFRQESLVGMRKTLVFYQGRAPKGKKTDWVMHEFRLEGPICGGVPSPAEEDWVLCRLFHKTTPEEAGKQETERCAQEDSHNPFLPPFMQIAFDQTNQHYLKQVSCFSIVNPNPTLADTCPTMPENLPTRSTIPGVGGMLPSHGIYDSSNPANNYAINPSAWDQNVLRAALNSHLATSKVESDYDHNYCSSSGMKGSPSRGEGSSDSHLSEVGLPSMWNLHGPTHRF